MAKAPLDEATLRETKDDLMGRLTRHQGYEGAATPDTRAAEDFLEPILRKVEHDHENERHKPVIDPRNTPSRNRQLTDGEDYGQADREMKVTVKDGEKVSVISEELGDVVLKADGTMEVSPEIQALADAPRHTEKEEAVLSCIRAMWQLPAWKDKLFRLYNSNLSEDDKRRGTHMLLQKWIVMFKPAGKQLVL